MNRQRECESRPPSGHGIRADCPPVSLDNVLRHKQAKSGPGFCAIVFRCESGKLREESAPFIDVESLPLIVHSKGMHPQVLVGLHRNKDFGARLPVFDSVGNEILKHGGHQIGVANQR